MPRVFLSYSRGDFTEVERLRSELIAKGIKAWWDQDILPGADWKYEIREAMKRSDAVLFCLSEQALQRTISGIYPEALDAIDAYRQRRPGEIFLIPIRLSECDIPSIELDGTRTLNRLQYVDLFPPDRWNEGLRSILRALDHFAPQPGRAAGESPVVSDRQSNRHHMTQVNLFRIVVVSPSDVLEEREAVEQIVTELNRILALDRRIVMMVYRWETDSYPGFHPKGPQGLIDPILRIEECDLLVGIFWRRLGTKTTDGTTGAEHEFLTAYEAWRAKGWPRIMTYFNQKEFFPEGEEEISQLIALQEFRDRFPEQGMWWKYRGGDEFKRLFRDHLINFLRAEFPVVI